jgi:uncharacterized LabA/DUF88 family protein
LSYPRELKDFQLVGRAHEYKVFTELFSGDGDFRSLVQAVQRRGVRAVVVSSMSTQPPVIAQELRRQADEFIDIKALQNKINRDPVQARRLARHHNL